MKLAEKKRFHSPESIHYSLKNRKEPNLPVRCEGPVEISCHKNISGVQKTNFHLSSQLESCL